LLRARVVVRGGGDSDAPGEVPAARVWSDGFVIGRLQVSCGQFLAALDRLVDEGREDEALANLPMPDPLSNPPASKALRRDDAGHFHLKIDENDRLWSLDWPIVMVNLFNSAAYASWEAGWTGMPWRLPLDLEWEKAARGVDGRFFPWGSFHDPSWCYMRSSQKGLGTLLPLGGRPLDQSPYGVRDTAGNVAEWCFRAKVPNDEERIEDLCLPLDPEVEGLQWSVRGGAWGSDVNYCRVAGRVYQHGVLRAYHASFRLLRPLDPWACPQVSAHPTAAHDV
jgi:formylglycine-generating enzyme required for sulfatase activity